MVFGKCSNMTKKITTKIFYGEIDRQIGHDGAIIKTSGILI